MKLTILVPHWKTGKMTAYAISQLLRFKGKHNIQIVVVDNNYGDGSLEYLTPFKNEICTVVYPKNRLQSHGVAFDYALQNGFVENDFFITIESDSFPTQDNWLDYYESLINDGYVAAGSLLRLSGGQYLHPCGAMYHKNIWAEAKRYVESMDYNYYPNFMMRENFPTHAMIHKSLVHEVETNPFDWVELSPDYKDNTRQAMREKLEYYSPVGCGVFHNGMGGRQESLSTYGLRTVESDSPFIILPDKSHKIIGRMGYEPGQFMSYYLERTGKKIKYIPTETKWLNGKEGIQQEYTFMENGFKHLWGVSAYKDFDPSDEVAKIKQSLPERLYDSLPSNKKI